MINEGLALPYFEPEGKVKSRSGDECVVALCDQWYLKYGEAEWKQRVSNHINNVLETYGEKTKNEFKAKVEWLKE